MLNKLKPTVAIIDSGIGGVSVLNQLIKKYKCGNYIYFADNLFLPYGNMTKSALKKRLLAIIDMLKAYEVDKIIVACNTASSVLYDCNIPELELMRFDKENTYFATQLTKKSMPNCKIIADSTLAKVIEFNINNKKQLEESIKKHIKTHKLNKLKSVVLACTHYELVAEIFKKFCSHTKIYLNSKQIIDNFNIDFKTEDLSIYYILSKPNFSYYQKLKSLVNIKGE